MCRTDTDVIADDSVAGRIVPVSDIGGIKHGGRQVLHLYGTATSDWIRLARTFEGCFRSTQRPPQNLYDSIKRL